MVKGTINFGKQPEEEGTTLSEDSTNCDMFITSASFSLQQVFL